MTVALAYLQSLVPALGWTLAHFLWQGALVALALQVALKACRTSRARHDWALAALVLMAILPMATFAWLQSGVRIVLVPRGFPGLIPVGQRWETLAVGVWLLGVAALAVRMAGGLVLVERLRRTAAALPPEWATRCRRLERRLGVRLRVLFAQSEAVATPIVAGWLRPMVLIPAGFLTRLPPAELEALILHELAHVRRLDAFANLIQSMVETLLFYHPAVWWVSRRIRLEREQCCDDLAVAAVRDPALYVRALQSLDALRPPASSVLAAGGGDLKRRAARILGIAATPERPALSRTAAVLILTATAAAMTHGASVQAGPSKTSVVAPMTRIADVPPAAEIAATPSPTAPERTGVLLLAEAPAAPGTALAVAAITPVLAATSAPVAPIRLALAAAAPPQTLSLLVIQPQSKAAPDAKIVAPSGQNDILRDEVAIWPRTAYQARYDGRVTLRCKVDVHGLAERCDVVAETPRDQGFGKAALEMRPTFMLPPTIGPDGPVETTKTIAIQFRAPDTQIAHIMQSSCESNADGTMSCATSVNVSVTGNPLPMRPVTMLDFPVWVTAADFDDLARAYPRKGGGVEGYAVAHCQVRRTGVLSNCQVIKEAPERAGFGEAALTLAQKFKVDPQLAATEHSAPLWVDVPIRFAPPGVSEREVTAPLWVAGVDARQAPHVFPPAAAEQGLTSGHGVARCTVAANGALVGCVPDPDAPDSLGFSAAAAHLASVMKMNLWSADAAPVIGGVVHVPIRLNLKQG